MMATRSCATEILPSFQRSPISTTSGTITVSINDYGFELLAPKRYPFDELIELHGDELLDVENLDDDLEQALDEIVLLIMGGLFVLETASVIIQVASFKLTGKRWQIERGTGEAQPSLREAQEAEAKATQDRIRSHPLVQATLEAFPEGELIEPDEKVARTASAGRNWN